MESEFVLWDAGTPQRGQQSRKCLIWSLWVEKRRACIYLCFYWLFVLSAQIWWSSARTIYIRPPEKVAGEHLLLRLWIDSRQKMLKPTEWNHDIHLCIHTEDLTYVQQPGFLRHFLPQWTDVTHTDRSCLSSVACRHFHLIGFFKHLLPLC